MVEPKQNLIHRNVTSKSQIVISLDKEDFVFIQNKGLPFIIMSTFDIEDYQIYPCIKVPINRISHTQNLLKLLPGGIILHSDGNWISVDVISKTINFESTSLRGLIQFQILDKNTLELVIVGVYKVIPTEVTQYITFEINKEEIQPDVLNISSIMLNRGSIVCITDAIEKILILPIKDITTGCIGVIKKYDLKLFNVYKKIWSELKFRIERINDEYHIYSTLLKHEIIHKLMPIYNDSFVAEIACKE